MISYSKYEGMFDGTLGKYTGSYKKKRSLFQYKQFTTQLLRQNLIDQLK